MHEKAERIVAKSAYAVSEELRKINAFMCAENYLTDRGSSSPQLVKKTWALPKPTRFFEKKRGKKL